MTSIKKYLVSLRLPSKISFGLFAFLLFFNVSGVSALSKAQKQIIKSDIFYFDVDVCRNETYPSGNGTAPATSEEFINQYGQLAFNTGKKYGIPYDAILAQAALESGWGKSKLTVEAFNFFGIKAGAGWQGPIYTTNTTEEVNGRIIIVKANFRAYADAQAGFDGYGDFILSNSRYNAALQFPNDPVRYIQELKKAGYATDSQYVNKVVNILRGIQKYIADHDLFPPSSEVVPDVEPPPIDSTGSTTSRGCQGTTNSSEASSVVRVAEEEYAKDVREYDENVLKYTDGFQERWCADFVSWVFNEAGVPFTGGLSGGWRYPSVMALQAYFQAGKNGSRYFEVGTEPPQPGDVAFYIGSQTPDGGSDRHVNIVISVDGDKMVTIGGNESNSVRRSTKTIAPGAESLVGFGRIK